MYKKTATYDEPGHFEFGKRILTDKTVKPLMQRMAITVLNVIPVLTLEKIGIKFSERGKLFISRFSTVVISAILAVFIFLWAKNIYGLKAGYLSLSLYALSPNMLAHSRLVTNDVYCTAFMFIGSYFFITYLKYSTLKNLILSSIFTGLAQASKHTALILLPAFFLFYLFERYIPSIKFPNVKIPSKKELGHLFLFLIIVIMVINICYGFKEVCIEKFIPLPKSYIKAFLIGQEFNVTGKGHGLVYLTGKLSQYGFWNYYIVCLLLKVPIATFLGGVISLLLLKNHLSENVLDEIAFLIIPIGLFIFFSFFCTAQLGIRYLLPAFPFIFVSFGKIAVYQAKKYNRLYKTGIIGLLMWYVISSSSFFPHYISYFNELIGDRKNMYKYLADSNVDWGQNGIYVNEYLKKHQYIEKIHVKPQEPVEGLVLVNVNDLVGMSHSSRKKYTWLRKRYEPIDHIGYSWLVYRIAPFDEDEAATRKAMSYLHGRYVLEYEQ